MLRVWWRDNGHWRVALLVALKVLEDMVWGSVVGFLGFLGEGG